MTASVTTNTPGCGRDPLIAAITAFLDALLVFAEGTRSRSGEMQRLRPGVARYLTAPGTWVLPVGIAGSEALFPIDEGSLNPVRIEVRIGAPIGAGALREQHHNNRQRVMDTIGRAIAALLPPRYRGAYRD
jgi:1-acyl-sn-glycerol-3-phosphate acyltransferase